MRSNIDVVPSSLENFLGNELRARSPVAIRPDLQPREGPPEIVAQSFVAEVAGRRRAAVFLGGRERGAGAVRAPGANEALILLEHGDPVRVVELLPRHDRREHLRETGRCWAGRGSG